jgi:hypothetical protein
MAIKYTKLQKKYSNVFNSKALQNMPKMRCLAWKSGNPVPDWFCQSTFRQQLTEKIADKISS